ncbi:hypothetical protein JJC00_26375 [Bradyrhizobium diazoefficiens]|uniref:hypothetical protein n=1 Tax=Bradyrhizobium diazoefficiens TaxID=1355477 RepID=UPI00190C953A|nr:hypothetical protein [Bradyrhizobium diazoefficiens]QQO32099.1 hypothetical protein JJC00_26375 [Bradyrhizobium diazoefficiens]
MTASTDEKLDAILEAIKGLDARVTRIEAGSSAASVSRNAAAGGSKKRSVKEFLLENPPATDIQRTLGIGYFLEMHLGMSSFTRAELEKGYSDAKEPMPSNIGVNIRHCIKQGHLMEPDEKKNNKTAYVVTRSGEQFVAGGYKKPTGGK